MRSDRYYSESEANHFYQSFVMNFIDWTSFIINMKLSGNIFVILADGRILSHLIIRLFPNTISGITDATIEDPDTNGMAAYSMLCEIIGLNSNQIVTTEIVKSQCLDLLVPVLESHIQLFLLYHSPIELNIPRCLYIHIAPPAPNSSTSPQDEYVCYESSPRSEVNSSPIIVDASQSYHSVSSGKCSVTSVNVITISEENLFKNEEVVNRNRAQQQFYDHSSREKEEVEKRETDAISIHQCKLELDLLELSVSSQSKSSAEICNEVIVIDRRQQRKIKKEKFLQKLSVVGTAVTVGLVVVGGIVTSIAKNNKKKNKYSVC